MGRRPSTQSLDERQQRELELWHTWKQNPTEENLSPLMGSFQNLVAKRVGDFRGAAVPPVAIQGFANSQLLKALNTYKPGKAALGTWVTTHLRKVQSFVIKHQNFGRIPDARANNITDYQRAKSELEEQFGHEPDALSLAEHLGWSVAEVDRMQREQRRDLIASKSLEADQLPDLYSQKDREALRYIHYDLTPDERLVFEYTLGLYGKPQLSAAQIAKTMKISQPKVSRLRKKISDKLAERGV